jgi:hypothetical protein
MWLVGADYYGKIDRVPGNCHVRTRFLHVMFFPFVPTGSILIRELPSSEAAGPRNPSLQKRGACLIAEVQSPSGGVIVQSVAFAWIRALLVLLVIMCWSAALEPVMEPRGPGPKNWSLVFGAAAAGVVRCGLFWLSVPLSKPGRRRREFLLGLIRKCEVGVQVGEQLVPHSP